MEYKQFLAIKNNRTNRYLTIDQNNRLLSSGCHPFFKHTECNKQREIFQILNAANQDYIGPIIMQSAVLIYNPGLQAYLCCQQNGELKLENIPYQEASHSKATKFMIQGTVNQKKAITENDDVVFKFNDANYLISELSLFCSWNGPTISQDSTWKLQRSNFPPLPEWFQQRPFISLSYLQSSDQLTQCLVKQNERKPIGSHSYQIQSIYLIEDLLYAMMSIEGQYIKKKNGSFDYLIEGHLEQSTCDLSLQQMVSKILPMCSQHDYIENYIQQKIKFENGYISQAFCSAVKELMQKYLLMVNQLDYEFNQGEITLQKFWYYTQPSIRIINSIYVLIQSLSKQIGGTLLSTITNFINTSTDPQIVEVYSFLLQKSFIPYMKQLSNWIYYGRIDDPFEEFLVAEKKIQKSSIETDYKNDFWDQRFALRNSQIPKFLEKYQDIILRTGKYINVIGQKESPFDNYLIKNQGHIVQNQDFTHLVSCFEWANKEIINLLFQKENIHKRLKTIKTFFLFDSGDFFIHFIEAAESELAKDIKEISKEKLESLFDLAVRSMASNDAYKDDLVCYIDQYTINEQIYAIRNLRGIDINENKPPRTQKLKGIELFTLDIKVEWPANLIFSRASLLNYQILFRSLMSLNYLLKQLNEAWVLQKQLKDTGLHQKFLKQNFLLSRMQHLIKNYLYYVSYDVVEKNYTSLIQNLQNADNFEEVKEQHMRFSENCLKESLIIDQDFWKVFNKCTNFCSQFSSQIQKQNSSLMSFFTDNFEPKKVQIKEKITELVTGKQFQTLYETFIKNYDEAYRELIKIIKTYISQSKTYVVSLMIRLDYQFDYL
ncbi:unnamed protein product [Paramecium sonneborni]|uniref:Spindle pole body component n=1 Tax=Paramecium sonneborni TaxID=65129 RepID=A0A8S1KP87_9CILI|nr:unnamed protein product [Paramecium sonneborni]